MASMTRSVLARGYASAAASVKVRRTDSIRGPWADVSLASRTAHLALGHVRDLDLFGCREEECQGVGCGRKGFAGLGEEVEGGCAGQGFLE
jgi:hypothetical protein